MVTTLSAFMFYLVLGVIVAMFDCQLQQRRAWRLALVLLAGVAVPFGFLTLAGDNERPEADGKVLYVVERVRPGKTAEDMDRLIRVTLGRDGNLATATVLTAKAGFFGDPGKALIAEGRYIVTGLGGVVDAREGRIIHDQTQGYLLGVEKGRVIYRLYDPSSNLKTISTPGRAEQFGVFEFNLETHARSRPEAKHWYLDGVKSPDRSKAVAQSCWDELYLNVVDGPQKKLAEGKRVTVSQYARLGHFEMKGPVLWLDNERILTQEANGKLVAIDTQGRVERICEIAGLPAVLDGPRLWRDPKGRIVYSCGRTEHVIDLASKTATPLEEYALGHGFETTVETGTRGFRELFFEGKRIGTGVFSPEEIRTGPDVIARRDLGDQESRRSVSVLWTKLGFQWRSFDMDYGGVIGWAP
jgi:hypothetical protein